MRDHDLQAFLAELQGAARREAIQRDHRSRAAGVLGTSGRRRFGTGSSSRSPFTLLEDAPRGRAGVVLPLPAVPEVAPALSRSGREQVLGQVARGYAPAVVKVVSFAGGSARVTATANYVLREDVPLETHDGLMLGTRPAVNEEVARWSRDFERRAESQDVVAVRVAVAGLRDVAPDRARLEGALDALFSGHVHASRVESRSDGTIEARTVLSLAGRVDGKAERFRVVEGRIGSEEAGRAVRTFDGRSLGALHARLEAFGIGAHRLTLEPGAPAHGVEGAADRLKVLAAGGPARSSAGGVIEDPAGARETARAWRRDLRSHGPRDTMHLVLSSRSGVDTHAFRSAVRDFLHQEFADHKFMFALHTDKAEQGHIHAHAIVAMRSEAGRKIDPNRADFARWRSCFAQCAQAQGLKIAATGALERASSQSYGARDKAIVAAADQPRPGREDADRAYAQRPANRAMIENARRRIEAARANPIRIPQNARQLAVVNAALPVWSALLQREPGNCTAQELQARLSLSAAAGAALRSMEERALRSTASGKARADPPLPASEVAAMAIVATKIAERLPALTKAVFTRRSAAYLDALAARAMPQAGFGATSDERLVEKAPPAAGVERGAEKGADPGRSAEEVARLAGVEALRKRQAEMLRDLQHQRLTEAPERAGATRLEPGSAPETPGTRPTREPVVGTIQKRLDGRKEAAGISEVDALRRRQAEMLEELQRQRQQQGPQTQRTKPQS